ncbi:MAG: Biopolymer transport protein ExbB [Elusimicrobia bacterium]|nr:Biopolymer transport protein ExbB [Elusimicrobiota bacterium]
MGNVAWGGVLAAGWPVLSILFIASIVTFAIIFERWKVFSQIKLQSTPFLESLKKTADPEKIVAWCEKSDQPLASIAKAIYKAPGNREDKERWLARSIQALVQKYEMRVSILGTVASVAPFVGLLGTVIGIIRAFHAVASTSSEGASAVAIGISEALVGTAAGLVVAIPALLAYNYFVNQLRHFTQEWELTGQEIIDLSLKNVRGES